MTDTIAKNYESYVLPPNIVSKLDLARLVHEVEQIDAVLTTAAVQAKVGAGTKPQITPSEQLADFLRLNSLTLTSDGRARTELVNQLRLIKDKAPAIHMTFAVEADPDSLGQLALWLRQSIHPQAVISVGLQPGLVAGVYMRTPNRVFDMSLKGRLAGQHELLVSQLEAYRGRR